MILIITFVVCAFLIFKLKWFRLSGVSSVYLLVAFGMKCFAGIVLWYLYSHVIDIDRKDADIYRYYDDGMVIHSALGNSTGDYLGLLMDDQDSKFDLYRAQMFNWDRSYSLIQLNDNRTVIRVHAILALLTGGDILAHVVLFNLLAFIGLLYLFRGFRQYVDIPGLWFLGICILPPSLLFWGSGLLKECLVLLPLGLSFYAISRIYKEGKGWLHLVVGLLLFVLIKPYVLLSFLPLILYLAIRKWFRIRPFPSLGLTLVIGLLLLAGSSLSPSQDAIGILALKQKDFINLAQESQAGSFIDITPFDDFWSFLLQSPASALRTYVRPWLWEAGSGMDLMAAAENTCYILLLLSAWWMRREAIDWDIVILALLFLITMGVLIGSVTPVMGAIVRYKVPALPFLMMMWFALVKTPRLKLNRL